MRDDKDHGDLLLLAVASGLSGFAVGVLIAAVVAFGIWCSW
jgi:hypothetical protein